MENQAKVERESVMDDVKFEDFVLKYEGEVKIVAELLREPFDDSVNGLMKQISVLSAKMELLSFAYAYAEEFLTNAEYRKLVPKRPDLTDMDRRMALEFSTTKERLFCRYLELLNKNIEKYLGNAQSVLATKRAELTKFGGGEG